MSVIIGSARHDENGGYSGGSIDRQDPSEVSTQKFYLHSKGWQVIRAKKPEIRKAIADCCQWACDSEFGGYDQSNRDFLYLKSKPYGFDVRKVLQNWETDCSALVRVCVSYAFNLCGISAHVGDFYTGNEAQILQATGQFEVLKFTSEDDLEVGDILCTCSRGHTVIVTATDKVKKYPIGWNKDSVGWYYCPTETTYLVDQWATINHCRYYFNAAGYAVTGDVEIDGKRYYFEPTPNAAKECALLITNENGELYLWHE